MRLIAAGLTVAAGQATTIIGVKYARSDTLAAANVAGAGVYAQSNWNMAAASVGGNQGPPVTPINGLKDSTGATTGVAISSWTQTTVNSWSLGDTGSSNAKLLNSFSDRQPIIVLTGLAVAFPNGYDVVVYYSNNEGQSTSSLALTGSINDTAVRTIKTGPTASCSYGSVGFVEETGAAAGSTNFTVFTGFNDPQLTIALAALNNNGIAAFQIVPKLPASAATSTVTAAPGSLLADGTSTTTVTVTLKDGSGNPMAGKTVTLASSRGASDTISAASGLSSTTAGVVTFTVKSSTPGTSVFTATDVSDTITVSQTASVTYTAVPAVNAGNSTVTAAPSTLFADGTSSATVTVTLKDGSSNPIAGKTVTLASNRGASDTISAASGQSSAAGVVTFTVKSLTTGTPVLTATDTSDGNLTITQTATVTFTASPPVNAVLSTVTATPGAALADGASPATITVTLRDNSSNPVAGKTVTLASSRSAADTISAASGPSSAAGLVTFTVTSATPGDAVFTATDTTDTVVMTQTATVTFGPVPPVNADYSTVTATPGTLLADGTATSTITVSLKNNSNDPVAGKTVTLASSRGATDTISAATGQSSSSGVVTFTVKSSTAGAPVFTATDSTDSITVSQTATVIFTTVPAVSAANSTVTATPGSLFADGTHTATVTVTLKGASGNPIAGKIVTLASSRGATDTISAASGTSSAAGVVSFTVKSSTTGVPVFTATDTTDNNLTITQTATVTFSAAPVASAASSTVTAAPSPVVADGSSTATITVTLKDGSSNPIAGKTVTLASSRGASDTISAASGTSSIAGVVTFTVKSSTVGVPVFTAKDTTDGNLTITQTATVNFIAIPPVSAANSTVTVTPGTLYADGASTATVTVTLKNGSSNPVAGKTVTLASSRGVSDTISAASGPSSIAGVVTFTVKSSFGGASVFTATDSTDAVALIQTAYVTFTALPVKVALMVVATHLDDEGIYLGGVMPYYAGVLHLPTVHISMTSGDSSVPTITRETESRAVDRLYGLQIEPLFGHFKDWAMGSEAPYTKVQRNWSLWYEPDPGPAYYRTNGTVQTAASPFPNNNPAGQANPDEFDPGRWKIATYLATLIRLYQPEVLVTQDLIGESGHSNHVTTAWGVWDAYWLAADASVNLGGLPAWQTSKLYYHLYNRVATPLTPSSALPGTSYPVNTAIINKAWQDWSTPYAELAGETPLEVTNDGISLYASIGGPSLLTQFSTRYPEQFGLYASTVGADTVSSDGWARGGFFEHLMLPVWRQIHFGSSANGGDAADLNDFDHDGIPNLLEYAFGLDPKQNSAGLLPLPQRVDNNLLINFSQPVGVTDITYGAEWSTTLLPGSWTAVADTGTFPQHRFSVPVGTQTSLFLRLKVTTP